MMKSILKNSFVTIVAFILFAVIDMLGEGMHSDLPVRFAIILIPIAIVVLYIAKDDDVKMSFNDKMVHRGIWAGMSTLIAFAVIYAILLGLIYQPITANNILNGVEYLAFSIVMIVCVFIATTIVDIAKGIKLVFRL